MAQSAFGTQLAREGKGTVNNRRLHQCCRADVPKLTEMHKGQQSSVVNRSQRAAQTVVTRILQQFT